MSFFEPDKVKYARWIILGGAGLFICGYVYKNLTEFFDFPESKVANDKNKKEPISNPTDEKQDASAMKDEEEEKKDNRAKFPVQVFVRMRPLVGKEIVEGHESLKYNVKKLKKKQTQSLVLKGVFGRNNERDKKFTGFREVIVPKCDNQVTFNKCLLPSIDNLFLGEKMCVFAYGHTGSGIY